MTVVDVAEPSEAAPVADDGDRGGPGPDVPGSGGGDRLAAVAAVTGLLLVPLVAVHVTTLLVRDPGEVDPTFLIRRWRNGWWLFADWTFLLVATVHALTAIARRASASRRPFAVLAAALIASFSVVMFLAASWGMMRLT